MIALTRLDEFYLPVYRQIIDLRNAGCRQKDIAEILNANGLQNFHRNPYQQMHVSRLLKRADELDAEGLLTPATPATSAPATPAPQQPVREETTEEKALRMVHEMKAKEDREMLQLIRQYQY